MVKGDRFLTLEQDKLESVVLALQQEEDGKQLKRDLGQQLKEAVEPALPIIRGELMAMGGSVVAEPGLRTSVASAMSTRVRYSGSSPGVRVAISRKGMPRGFTDAARRINQGEWGHPVFGRAGSEVTQRGAYQFFDRPLQDRKEEMRRAVEQALDQLAERLSRRA